jgi:hypothetical protein
LVKLLRIQPRNSGSPALTDSATIQHLFSDQMIDRITNRRQANPKLIRYIPQNDPSTGCIAPFKQRGFESQIGLIPEGTSLNRL